MSANVTSPLTAILIHGIPPMSETPTREFEKLTRHTPSVSDGLAFMVTDYDHGQWLSRQSVLTLVADLQAENARLTAALRGLVAGVDAATEPYDDCHDCAAVNEWDDRENDSCALHSNMTLWQAYREALEALGPCWCGHTLSQHHDEDSTSCKACVDCSAFKHPAALTPKGETP